MSGIARIGFIGMGNMGVPMAANLVRAGYAVTAHDIATERAEHFAKEHNARAAGSLAALGQGSDVVITMLPSGREVRHALLEAEDGALVRNLRAGSYRHRHELGRSGRHAPARRGTCGDTGSNWSMRRCRAACPAPRTARSPS